MFIGSSYSSSRGSRSRNKKKGDCCCGKLLYSCVRSGPSTKGVGVVSNFLPVNSKLVD